MNMGGAPDMGLLELIIVLVLVARIIG